MAEFDLAAAASTHKKLFKLARKRLERFVSLLPKMLVNDDPNTIHDLRVGSRRLQQAVRVVVPNPKSSKCKKTVRTLRRVRRAFGPCRNLDVNIALISEKRGQAATAIVRRSWEALQRDLEEKRDLLLESARREITGIDLFAFIERAQALFSSAKRDQNGTPDTIAKLADATAEAMKACDDACVQAYEARDQYHLHRFRIAAKRVRYRVELLVDLGQAGTKPFLTALKELQTVLGDWHDRSVLLQSMAEFISKPDFLADHPDMSKALLAEMEKDKLCTEANLDQLFDKSAKMHKLWEEWKSEPANVVATTASDE
jgi:CHAD domain-containing protein